MRFSSGFIPTAKEIPADAQIPSHQLLIRSGMIRSLAAGVYAFLPLGYRVLQKISAIVREEMNAIGGQELHLPALSPIELWEATGRVKAFGETLFHIKDRPLILAPTHEEVICWLAKNHVKSYRDLPQIWYQVQTKFRNEPRPRSGIIRGRQFLMKDSYTLDATWEGLDQGYAQHAVAYKKIFERCGLSYFVVGASSGAMGGTGSEEFMVESDAGEDLLVLSEDGTYAANLEVASSTAPAAKRSTDPSPLEEVHTPNVRTIDQLSEFLHVEEQSLAKSVVYWAGERPILCLMMGNDALNEAKLTRIMGETVRPVEAEALRALTGADGGSIGPVRLNRADGVKQRFTILADLRLKDANNLVSGANRNDFHLMHIDLTRDCRIDGFYDLRMVREGEGSPEGNSPLRIVRGIELGHIFKLGTRYSEALQANFLDEQGKEQPVIMGSYGIGIERILACHVEQHHDRDGITWGRALAPFDVHLLALSGRSESVKRESENLYREFQEHNLDVLFDDRQDVSPGYKFKDADLLGMPLQVIVGERTLSEGNIEFKIRQTQERKIVLKSDAVKTAMSILASMV